MVIIISILIILLLLISYIAIVIVIIIIIVIIITRETRFVAAVNVNNLGFGSPVGSGAAAAKASSTQNINPFRSIGHRPLRSIGHHPLRSLGHHPDARKPDNRSNVIVRLSCGQWRGRRQGARGGRGVAAGRGGATTSPKFLLQSFLPWGLSSDFEQFSLSM